MTRQEGLVSLIICSAGREDALDATLKSLAGVSSPEKAELILVDNNVEPRYRELFGSIEIPGFHKAFVHEPERGLSNARNRGIRESRGEWIVFTDDDLRFEPDFLVELLGAMRNAGADGAAGTVRIAPELEEPWMQPWHRIAFASTEHMDMADPRGFVGANFGFHSRVLDQVSGFDPELGAGKLGTGEETLFAKQLMDAGYRIVGAPRSVVWHHFDPSRKTRESLTRASRAWGQSNAHIDYHYRGVRKGMIPLRRFKAVVALALARLAPRNDGSPMGVRESTILKHIAYLDRLADLQRANQEPMTSR